MTWSLSPIFSKKFYFPVLMAEKEIQQVRVDKWLWSVRIFKSRSLATEACKSGKVHVNGSPVKAAFSLTGGEHILARKAGFNFEFEVVKLIEKRVSASLAAECYINKTPDEEMNKYEDWFVGKKGVEYRERGTGRPTKKERRELDDFKVDRFDTDF